MCRICRSEPCHPMCPTAYEPAKPIMQCSKCGADIYDGDFILVVGETVLCDDCALDREIARSDKF